MKLKVTLTLILFGLSFTSLAQESTSPIVGVTIERKVSVIDIEGEEYKNVTVSLKSVSSAASIWGVNRVIVKIKNSEGEMVWRKAFNDTYLYVFSNGQIQVGKPNFDMIIIFPWDEGVYHGKVRVKEGIY